MREPSVWVLVDDRPGNASQALGVAEALGWPFVEKSITYTLLGKLANVLRGSSLLGVSGAARRGLVPPWPDVVVAAGRRSAPVARWIKKRSGGRTCLCQIMWPQAGVADFDLIAVPTHEQVFGTYDNMLRITGAPHRVTEARLALEAVKWKPRLGALKRPRIAVMIGGSTRTRTFTPAMARDLGERVAALCASAGGRNGGRGAGTGTLMVSTSRRTGREAEEAFLSSLPEPPAALYRWGDTGGNPYFGYLACADAVVVTGDSVSMVSEACATRAPVYVYAPDALVAPKHARLHVHLYALGMAEALGAVYKPWVHPPLNAATDVAKAVRQALVGRT